MSDERLLAAHAHTTIQSVYNRVCVCCAKVSDANAKPIILKQECRRREKGASYREQIAGREDLRKLWVFN